MALQFYKARGQDDHINGPNAWPLEGFFFLVPLDTNKTSPSQHAVKKVFFIIFSLSQVLFLQGSESRVH